MTSKYRNSLIGLDLVCSGGLPGLSSLLLHTKMPSELDPQQKRMAAAVASLIATVAAVKHIGDCSDPLPIHTSILTGQQWVEKLLKGHPERIHMSLGVSKDVFLELCKQLHISSYMRKLTFKTLDVLLEKKKLQYFYTLNATQLSKKI